MCFCAVNMYKSIIIVLLSFISCGLTNHINETSNEIIENEQEHCRKTSPMINASRNYAHNCFRSIVRTHLNFDDTYRICSTVNDLKKELNIHIKNVKSECLPTLMTDKSTIMEFVKISFSNDDFKEFYSDLQCVKKQKPNITRCINDTFGSTNVTHKKHSSWITKSQLDYNNWSCDKSHELNICVNKSLSVCKPTTRDFVASLFNISINHCHDLRVNNTARIDREPKSLALIFGISAALIILGAEMEIM